METALTQHSIAINTSTSNRNTVTKPTGKLRQTQLQHNKNNTDMSIPWGDSPTFKNDDSCRIIMQNVNGLGASYNSKSISLAAESDALCADIIGLIETNTHWKYGDIQQTTKKSWQKYFNQTKLAMSSSNIHFDSPYQPGGTMMVVGSPWASRTRVNTDPSGLGRWTEAEITGKDNTIISIITVYAVGKNKIGTCGPHTNYFQQWNILNANNTSTTIDPRDNLFVDLNKLIVQKQHNNKEVIVLIDANDTLQNPNSKLTKWTKDTNLMDIHLELHGTEDEPPTYARGSNRIDYILVTQKISNYITSAGIMPMHEYTTSDHRALFIDIDLKRFLGGEPHDIMSINGRTLTTSDPRTVMKYQKFLLEALNESNIENDITSINKEIQEFGKSQETITRIEEIDVRFTKMKLDCERKSKQPYRHPWSPILKGAYRNHQFWSLWLSETKLKNKNNKKGTRNVDFSIQREKYSDDSNKVFIRMCNTKTIHTNLKAPKIRLKEIRKQALEHRNDFLRLQIEAYRTAGSTDDEKALKNIQYREYKRRVFRKLRGVMGKLKSSGLDHILRETVNGTTERIGKKEDMFKAIIERNIQHFSQADGTPFTIDPLKSLIGPTATSDFCDEIIKGRIDLSEMDIQDASKAILSHLGCNKDNTEIDVLISDEDILQGYKKWNENTSTSPSGCHLGHEKAILKRIEQQENDSKELGIDPLYRRIFKITSQKLNWSIAHGHVYERWKKVVNAMIEKIPGKPLLNKLRIIHLIESDFNLMIGILWGRRLVWHGEERKQFDDGQSGSRPGKRCQDLLSKKDAILSIWRMSRTDGIFFDNDAKSCFDRIVMTLGSICSQHMGMPKKACELFLKTLQSMNYHIKTSFGISEEHYHSTRDYTIHGPGQGGRGSPSMWLIISSIIMKCARERSKGAVVKNPFSTEEHVVTHITGFVDDVTHWISNPKTIGQQILDTQITAQWWEQLLYTTGGKLELSKCFIYVMHWFFDSEGQAHITRPQHLPTEIQIKDSESNESYNIDYRNCDDPHKSLGVLGIPSGSNKAEFERLLKKSKSFAQRISTAHISRLEAKTLYYSFYLPGMLYSMCVGSLSKEQCQKIQGVTTQKFLSTMGFNRCLPSAVVYANKECGGIGLRHLFAEQGTEKIYHIIQSIRTNSDTGKLIKIRLQWAQRVAGIQRPILEDTASNIPQLDHEPWISTLRTFLHESELSIVISGITSLPTKRNDDKFLMELAYKIGSKEEIIKINRCRIFLHALTISDVASPDGSKISTQAFNCEENAIVQSDESWPQQPRPGKRSIAAWQKFLKTLTEFETLQLQSRLASWIIKPQYKIYSSSKIFYDINSQTIWKETTRNWQRGIGRSSRRGYEILSWSDSSTTPDRGNLIPAGNINTDTQKEIITWSKFSDNRDGSNPEQPPRTWKNFIDNNIGIERTIMQDAHVPFIRAIQALAEKPNKIQVFTNYNMNDQGGTYSWIMESNRKIIGKAKGTVFGYPVTKNRAELTAHFSWNKWLTNITAFTNITDINNILIYTPSKSIAKVLSQGFQPQLPKNAMMDDYDLINEIHTTATNLRTQQRIIQETRAIKNKDILTTGRKKSKKDSPIYLSSERARAYAYDETDIMNRHDHFVLLPSCDAYLVSGTTLLSSGEQQTARWKWSEFHIQDYYCKKLNLTIDELHQIDWMSLRQTRGRLPQGTQTFSIKYAIDWLPTGSRMELQGDMITECIHCGGYEDSEHLLQCKKRTEKIDALIERFKIVLDEHGTAPKLKETLVLYVGEWLHKWSKKKTKIHAECIDAVNAQSKIGWNYFAKGIWSNKWKLIQEQFETSKKQKITNWSSKIMSWWIETSFQVWKDRNERVHNTTINLSNRQHDEAMAQVRSLYEREYDVTLEDRNIFEMDVERRIQFPTKSLQIWVTNMTQRIKTSMTVQAQRLTHGQSTLTNWFRKVLTTKQYTSTTAQIESIANHTEWNEKQQICNKNQSEPRTLLRIE